MTYDVAIIGNSISANLLARHLNIEDPSLKIVIIGPADTPPYGVGESLTELASHFIQHRLKLAGYLYRNHLTKIGLTFYFDTQPRQETIATMSEIAGPRPLSYNPFHIDRAIFDRDIKQFNAEDGIHFIDATVTDCMTEKGKLNTLTLDKDGTTDTINVHWIVDASGRKRFLAEKLDLKVDVSPNTHCAVWAHFKGSSNVDIQADEDFRRRNNFLSRDVTTMHFVNDGYWFWVIPAADNVTSVGLVYDETLLKDKKLTSKKNFLKFLDEHKALSRILPGRELLNFKALTRYAYTSKEFVCDQRCFALIGDAAGFTDPFYSSGIDITAKQCDLYTEIILNQLGKRSTISDHEEYMKCANLTVGYNYRYYAGLILGNNACMGSYEIFTLKYLWEFFLYFLNTVWSFLSHRMIEGDNYKTVKSQLDLTAKILGLVTDNFRIITEDYKRTGLYDRRNSYFHAYISSAIYIDKELSKPLTPEMITKRYEILVELTQYVVAEQLNLFLQRNDLLKNRCITDELRFPNLIKFAEDSENFKGQNDFLTTIGQSLKNSEQDMSDHDFWREWITADTKPRMTKHSGEDFSELKKGVIKPTERMLNSRTSAPNIVKLISAKFSQTAADPDKYLKRNTKDALFKPFSLESAAAGYIRQGYTIQNATDKLCRMFGNDCRPLILTGCGYGLQDVSVEKAFEGFKDNEHIEHIANGYGFRMGLNYRPGMNFISFPSSDHRSPLVKGLGRSVTFILSEDNTPEKYEKYFKIFGLYPGDEKDFYTGAGFSIGFTETFGNAEETEDYISENFPKGIAAHIKRGAKEAAVYRGIFEKEMNNAPSLT